MCYSLEFFLSLAFKVSYKPLRRESILRWHPPAHYSIQESFALACVKAQNLLKEQFIYVNYYYPRA